MVPQLLVFQSLAGELVKDGQGDCRGCVGMLVRCLLDIIIIVVRGKGVEGVAMKLRTRLVGNGHK